MGTGGIPVNNAEIEGVSMPASNACETGRKKPAAASGQNMGRKISPNPIE
jgi:hypothetical protein